jgi:hypothetical protein
MILSFFFIAQIRKTNNTNTKKRKGEMTNTTYDTRATSSLKIMQLELSTFFLTVVIVGIEKIENTNSIWTQIEKQ